MIRYKEVKEETCKLTSSASGAEEQSFELPVSLIEYFWSALSAEQEQVGSTLDGLQPRLGKPLKGREHLTLTAQKPWAKDGLSRSTWYRRRKRLGLS